MDRKSLLDGQQDNKIEFKKNKKYEERYNERKQKEFADKYKD